MAASHQSTPSGEKAYSLTISSLAEAEALMEQCYDNNLKSAYRTALNKALPAYAWFKAVGDSGSLANAAYHLGVNYIGLKRHDLAMGYLQEASDLAKLIRGDLAIIEALALLNLGVCEHTLNNSVEAIPLLQAAISSLNELNAPNPDPDLVVHENRAKTYLGACLIECNEFSTAITLLKDVIKTESSQNGFAHQLLGLAYLFNGDFIHASLILKKLYSDLNTNPIEKAKIGMYLGVCHFKLNNLVQANQYLTNSIHFFEKIQNNLWAAISQYVFIQISNVKNSKSKTDSLDKIRVLIDKETHEQPENTLKLITVLHFLQNEIFSNQKSVASAKENASSTLKLAEPSFATFLLPPSSQSSSQSPSKESAQSVLSAKTSSTGSPKSGFHYLLPPSSLSLFLPPSSQPSSPCSSKKSPQSVSSGQPSPQASPAGGAQASKSSFS